MAIVLVKSKYSPRVIPARGVVAAEVAAEVAPGQEKLITMGTLEVVEIAEGAEGAAQEAAHPLVAAPQLASAHPRLK